MLSGERGHGRYNLGEKLEVGGGAPRVLPLGYGIGHSGGRGKGGIGREGVKKGWEEMGKGEP